MIMDALKNIFGRRSIRKYTDKKVSPEIIKSLLDAGMHAHGLGSVWLGMYPREERMNNVGTLLELPGHILPLALISIGYPDERREIPARYSEERVHWNKF